MKTLTVAVLLMIMSLSAFAQQPPQPEPPSARILCLPGESRLLLSERADGVVLAVCHSEGRAARVGYLFSANNVRQTIPGPNNTIYALSYEEAFRYVGYPDGGSSFDSYLIPSNGFGYSPDPYHSEFGGYFEQSLTFRFPWSNKTGKIWFYGQSSSYFQSLAPDMRINCITVLNVQGHEYCQRAQTASLIVPNISPVGASYTKTTELFAGKNLTNIVAGADGKMYATFAARNPVPQAGQPTTREPGKLVAFTVARDGSLTEQVIANYDVYDDSTQNRLVATSEGIYFGASTPVGDNQFRDVLWFMSYRTNRLSPVLVGNDRTFISGLAFVSQNNNAVNTNVPRN